MYTNTYKQADLQAMPQNQLESRTLIKAASMMNRVKDNWNLAPTELATVLEHNRKLWTILSSEMAEEDHPMSHELRQNIANLALFIFKHTIKIMAEKEPKAKDLEILITINMEVARGLNELAEEPETEEQAQVTPKDAHPETKPQPKTDSDAPSDSEENGKENEEEIHIPSNIIT